MIQVRADIVEEEQELSIVGENGSVQLRDDDTISGSGLEEGTKLVLKVVKEKEEKPIGDDPDNIPEGATRVFVKCDIKPGKTRSVTLYVSPTETGKEMKERAYIYFVKLQPVFGRDRTADDYGL